MSDSNDDEVEIMLNSKKRTSNSNAEKFSTVTERARVIFV